MQPTQPLLSCPITLAYDTPPRTHWPRSKARTPQGPPCPARPRLRDVCPRSAPARHLSRTGLERGQNPCTSAPCARNIPSSGLCTNFSFCPFAFRVLAFLTTHVEPPIPPFLATGVSRWLPSQTSPPPGITGFSLLWPERRPCLACPPGCPGHLALRWGLSKH